jgi:HEAT repeat protein
MTGTEMLRLALGTIFVTNAVLIVTILVVKPVHRLREQDRRKRRRVYVSLLAQHLMTPEHRIQMGRRVADDQAFLDALIDMRTVVTGDDAETLGTIVDRFDIARTQGQRLGKRWRGHRRLRDAVALAELADASAAGVLIEHLSDREQEVRIQCARGLGRMRWTPGINAILARFDVETPWVRSRFSDSLISYGDTATWPLLAYVASNHRLNTSGVPTAIRTLGAIGDPLAVRPMIELFEEAVDPEVQIALVEALGQIGGPMELEPLEKAARSEDWRVRAKAATALGSVGNVSILSTLADGLADQNWWVRNNSAHALTQIPSGIDLLYDALLHEDRYARDAASEALSDAGELLAARDRIEAGIGARRDFELLEYVTGRAVSTG